jgi:1,4-alpha-glucan branching enzyme
MKSPLPESVAVIGSFSDWQAIPLEKDQSGQVWQLMLNNLPGNCTHRYMLLLDGKPAKDANADGLAIPETEQEKAWALTTPRGPRLFMLFSQTK